MTPPFLAHHHVTDDVKQTNILWRNSFNKYFMRIDSLILLGERINKSLVPHTAYVLELSESNNAKLWSASPVLQVFLRNEVFSFGGKEYGSCQCW